MDTTWLEVTLTTTEDQLETLSAQLTMNGVTGLVVEDEADFHTFLEENRQYWDYVDDTLMERMKGAARIKFYVTDDGDGQKQLAAWTDGIPDLNLTTTQLRENDWATSWHKYYKPMTVGERLYIVPEWEKGESVPPGRVPLYLNPGLTFGTGSHASTRLCLEGVERYAAKGEQVLDLGCGSGILSIAALLLGASHALGVDIDPKAAQVAAENAAMNGLMEDRCRFLAGNVLDDDALAGELKKCRYRLVLANIVADVIIPLSAHALDLMTDDGIFLCSGIIDSRSDEVVAALRHNGLVLLNKAERDGWVSLAAERQR